MTAIEAIETNRAPTAVGPYSQGIRAGNLLFAAGQIGLDPESGHLVAGGVAAQARQAMDNLKAVLRASDASFENVVKSTIFLADMGDFATVNEIYGAYFGTVKPARTTIAVAALPLGALVEIELVAMLDG